MFRQYLQDSLDHSFMLLFRLCKDQNVVQVHYDNPFCYDSSEDVVHHSLEGGRAIGHFKKHYKGFVRATGHKAPGESSVNITVSSYDTTHLQENPQRLG